MNGIDAVAIATGNDWRAIEAGAHAYAAASGRYQPLSRWAVGDDGALVGTIDVPLKPGIVGGSLEANPGARLGLDVCAVSSASELAALMAAVGLAQNLAALRALATHGIQHGHMRLHARSVAASAGVPRDRFDAVVAALVESGEIKIWKAREIVAGIDDGQEGSAGAAGVAAGRGESNGKVILLGEHAAVYDKHVLAVPLPGAMRVDVSPASSAHTLNFRGPRSSGNIDIGTPAGEGMVAVIDRIREQLALDDRWFSLSVRSRIPPGMGLGASAAFAVAAIRALAACYGRELSDENVNALAFDCEKLSHGTPSGIDNTLATFGAPVLFRKQAEPPARVLDVPGTLPIVVGYGSEIGATIEQVAGVRKRRSVQPAVFDAIFAEIDRFKSDGHPGATAEGFCDIGCNHERLPRSAECDRGVDAQSGAHGIGCPGGWSRWRQVDRRRWWWFDCRTVSGRCRRRCRCAASRRVRCAGREFKSRAKRMAERAHKVVSSESEELILVDADDNPLGTLSKAACHDGDGVLHRAFSLFVFNEAGELLLQRRSAEKRLWPMYWSNSCCSHPRAGETYERRGRPAAQSRSWASAAVRNSFIASPTTLASAIWALSVRCVPFICAATAKSCRRTLTRLQRFDSYRRH